MIKEQEVDMIAHAKKGVLSLCLGHKTGDNIVFSLNIAERIAKTLKRGKVLYINTVHTERQLASEIRKHINKKYSAKKPDPQIRYETCDGGTLNSMNDLVESQIGKGVKFIIINSLEFSSKDYRRKDDLLYQMKTWSNKFGVTIILFAERVKSVASQGKIQRGTGAGKFACIAASITYLSENTLVGEDEGSEDEGMTSTEWREAQLRKQEEEEKRIAAEEEKAEQEEELLARAQTLAAEQEFLAADVPVWKARDEHEERAVIKTFTSCYWQLRKDDYESDEHFHKRLMAAIAISIEGGGEMWDYMKPSYNIVHSNNPDLPFEEELLPPGARMEFYYYPDNLPIPGERKPRIKKEVKPVRELFK